jgi:hypothetical protein
VCASALASGASKAADLRDGTYRQAQWNAATQRLGLAEGDPSTGSFTSQVLDAGEGSAFVSLTWLPDLAYGKGLPARDSAEYGYPGGNVDLRDALAWVQGAGPLRFPLEVDASGPITVFGWMREAGEEARSSKEPGSHILFRWGQNGAVEAVVRTDAGREITLTGLPHGAASNRAHHVAVVVDGSAAAACLYIDGRLADRMAIEARPFQREVAVEVAGAGAAPFGPEVSEFAAVARALTQEEISALARRGLARVRLQIARCADPRCDDATFVGPDGTEASSFDAQQEWSLAGIHVGRFMRYRVVLESADPLGAPTVASVQARAETVPLQPLADSDGDGVDDALDCRPFDNSVWAVPSEATGLLLSGNPPSFSWTQPADPGGFTLRYDVVSGSAATGFHTCVIRNAATTTPAGTDPQPAFTPLSYVVSAKNACGSSFGTDSSGTPRTGSNCFFGTGEQCTDSLECATGCCSPNTCVTLDTVQNCGTCGHPCAGQTTSSDAFCSTGNCGMTCKGENYDSNNDPSDGCELADSPTGNHILANALNVGNRSCFDSDTISAPGKVPSDGRTHTNPLVNGFNASIGAAPDFFTIAATGGLCVNDLALTLTVTGATSPACYRLSVSTNVGTFTCTTSAAGTCAVTRGSGSYANGTNITLIVEKTCALPVVQQVNYTISGHI